MSTAVTPDAAAKPGRSMGTVAQIMTVVGLVALTTLLAGLTGIIGAQTLAGVNQSLYQENVDGIAKAEALKYDNTQMACSRRTGPC